MENETVAQPKFVVAEVVKSKLDNNVKLQILNVCTKQQESHVQFYLCRYLSKNFVFRTTEISERELMKLEEI